MERVLLFAAFVYLPITFFTLIAYAKRNKPMRFFFKPLLMPSLAVLYILAAKTVCPWVLLALLCGCAGDIFLLGRHHWNLYCGIGAFALGHIFYITGMLLTGPGLHPVGLISVLWVGAMLVLARRFLIPCAPKRLRLPGTVYCALLSGVGASALYLAFMNGFNAAYLLCFVGGLLFLVSDGLLAYDKFGKKTQLGGLFVMVTYILAQTTLIVGFVLHGGI